MKYNSLLQIGLIVVSIVIVFTFIKPTFAEINSIQDELFQYSDAVAKATEFNSRLNELTNIANSLSASDRNKLDRLLPAEIDSAAIMHNIEGLIIKAELELNELSAGELTTTTVPEDFAGDSLEPILRQQDFNLTALGTYEQIKTFLLLLESNDQLLEIVTLDFSPKEEGGEAVEDQNDRESVFGLAVNVRAYSLEQTVNNEIEQ